MPGVSIPTNGAAIKHHRQMAGWNSTPFARHVGISGPYLSRLESGKRHGSAAVLRRIADALSLPMSTVVDESKTAIEAA